MDRCYVASQIEDSQKGNDHTKAQQFQAIPQWFDEDKRQKNKPKPQPMDRPMIAFFC